MNGSRTAIYRKVIALAIVVGALPFLNNAGAHAEESRWLDDYSQPVGLTYGVSQVVQSAYLWRGLNVGALNTQIDANIGYGGLYLDMWWSLGATNWQFTAFQPEVDFSLGFNRWGLNVFLLYIHNFNCGFFDFGQHPGQGGNALELDVRYTVSSKLPLSILWATRLTAHDGYLNAAGDTIRAYSSYLELSYTHRFKNGYSLYAAFGLTPWKSLYTHYEGDFAIQNIELRLRKDWDVAPRCGLMLQGQLAVNPAAPIDVINTNITFGVYLK